MALDDIDVRALKRNELLQVLLQTMRWTAASQVLYTVLHLGPILVDIDIIVAHLTREEAIVISLCDTRGVTILRLVSAKAMTTSVVVLVDTRSHLLLGEALFMIGLAHLQYSTTILDRLSHLQLRHFSLRQ